MRGGVLSIDLKGRITTFNASAERILGLQSSEVIDRGFAEVFLEIVGSDDFMQVVLDAIYDNSVTHRKRVEFPSSTGPIRLDMTTSFLFRNSGDHDKQRRVGVVAVFDDVTELENLREFADAMAALRVQQLVRAYRERGHILASLDPLGITRSESHPELEPEHYDLSPDELDEPYAFVWGGEPVRWPLRQIIEALKGVYCTSVGIQYMHIDDLEIQDWLRKRIEGPMFAAKPTREQQLRILRKLIYAETFEGFLQSNFRRAKRFSLEGAETIIPLLDQAIGNAADHGVENVLIGMSHRGRLNVLANVLDMPPAQIFKRFEQLDSGKDADSDGDVRFHLGVETEVETASGKGVRISLCFNPSHLEFVGPVVMGRARARQDRVEIPGARNVLPLVLHGDAAFSGQGVVQESLNMSRLQGYSTGGVVHIILNNQIGFTTEPHQSRSTQYPSDVARMLQVPIFHVNGEQPEAVSRVIGLAMDFWRTWHRDVVVDMYCYRRRGHMEQDDPTLTQPLMYRAIDAQPRVVERYTENLLKIGNVTRTEAEEITTAANRQLAQELAKAEAELQIVTRPGPPPEAATPNVTTAVPAARLTGMLHELGRLPENFNPHPKVKALLRRRVRTAEGRQPVDWATGELLAYATLLSEGNRVRISGQDSERGTFAHRHAVLHDEVTGEKFIPLEKLDPDRQGKISISNSPLTEVAVMAFEFGYSLEDPRCLVVWEAQFGDFANVAQVIIDQFLVSSRTKWRQESGLVLLLPHGLEGGGPEHSSARPERFLQLCASGNMAVVHLVTASQVFHCLREQALSPRKRPLIAFTPKRLLHDPFASSSLDELSCGRFQPVVPDPGSEVPNKILLCSGQVAAALSSERASRRAAAAIVRLDRLYPLPVDEFQAVLADYPAGTPVTWVQEEPENMGAWRWLEPQLQTILNDRQVGCVARPERASPATGSVAIHNREQTELMNRAFE